MTQRKAALMGALHELLPLLDGDIECFARIVGAALDESSLARVLAAVAGQSPIKAPRVKHSTPVRRVTRPTAQRAKNSTRHGLETLPPEAIAQIKSLGRISDAARAIGIGRSQLSPIVRGARVSPRVRDRILAGLAVLKARRGANVAPVESDPIDVGHIDLGGLK